MTRNELKILLKSIIMNDSLTDQNYYNTIMDALHKHLDIKNKPIKSLTENPIFQPGDVVLVPTYGINRNHYAILIDLMVPKNLAVIRYITHNNDLHPGIMIPVESRFLEGYFVPYNVMIPLTSIEKCCFPYDNQKQFKQLKKKMNDLHYSLCTIIFFILGIFVICIEIHEIKEDYKEYKKFTYILGI